MTVARQARPGLLTSTGEVNVKLDPNKLLALKVPSAGAAKVGLGEEPPIFIPPFPPLVVGTV